ncbi:MAG TPA: CHAT domain-containing protein, partial [Terriglobia bacterium]|nr:CHAT domain-containing protein [Terriglobia bacterium]
MASERPITVFQVIVGKAGTITVAREPRSEDIPICKVIIDKLQQRTTQVLVGMLREGRLKSEEEFKVLGANLYRVLFANEIGKAVTDALYQPLKLVRVELEFDEEQEILSSWPWEYLYCPEEYGQAGSGYFLAGQKRLVLTRRIRLNVSRRQPIDKPPLKVLLVASGPTGHPIEYDKVREAIESPGTEMIKVTALLPSGEPGKALKATWSNFTDMLDAEDFHAIHFLGHGKWDSDKKVGTILFMRKDNTADPRSQDEIATTLMGMSSLHLVFLQACESAESDPYQAFSGVAQQLAQKAIPA